VDAKFIKMTFIAIKEFN